MKAKDVYNVMLVSPNDLTKVIKVGNQLSLDKKEGLVTFIHNNADVFAWSHENIPRINPEFICYRLSMDSKT